MKALLAAFLFAFPSIAMAQSSAQDCAPIEMIAEGLKKRFDEHLLFMGISETGPPLIIFQNKGTGTWTALVVPQPGIACEMTSGVNARSFPPQGAPLVKEDPS